MSPHCYTRRQALQSAGGALLAAGLLGAWTTPAGADAVSALNPERAAALAAVLAALAQGPAADLDAVDYASRFEAFYDQAPSPFRQYADGALDAVAAETAFTAAAPEEGYALLQSWAADPSRQLTVASALELASLSFAEDELKTPGFGLVTGATA